VTIQVAAGSVYVTIQVAMCSRCITKLHEKQREGTISRYKNEHRIKHRYYQKKILLFLDKMGGK
jgi:hypothetical protein